MKHCITLFAALIIGLALSAQNDLTLKIQNPQVNGNFVTYDVAVDNFTDMVGMQFSITFMPEQLSFVSIENINLPDLVPNNFNNVDPGAILCVWVQPSLAGVTLNNNDVMFQIQFEMSSGTYGNVCFSEDPITIEMIKKDAELLSFMIIDDCHETSFQIILSVTSIEEIASTLGISIDQMIHDQQISFQLIEGESLSFTLYDMNGKVIHHLSKRPYEAGHHNLHVSADLLPGMYILTASADKQPVSIKLMKI